MATKTGAELKLVLLGDANEMENTADYTMNVDAIDVRVSFPYSISSPEPPDTGERSVGRVVRLTAAEMAAGLDAGQRQALLDLVASKIV